MRVFVCKEFVLEYIDNGWSFFFQKESESEYFIELKRHVDEAYRSSVVYPPREQIFRAFELTDVSNVKVVILGQDPYHEKGQANGLAFSVLPDVKIPPSLVNIYKEMVSDIHINPPKNGCLDDLAKQGVLLLNNVLTVEEHHADSHKNFGWQTFTNHIIQFLDKQNQPMVFLLWGNQAIKKKEMLHNTNHLVLTAAHPSPLSAYRGFFGCRHFSLTNEYLRLHGMDQINWQL